MHGALVDNVCCVLTSQTLHENIHPQQVVGVAEVALEPLPRALAGPCMLPKGSTVAFVSNMAVLEPHRRRGLGRRLLQQCCADVAEDAAAVLLYVRRDNAVAADLYASEGFEAVEWTDPEWLASAYRGEVGGARRLLFMRRREGLQTGSERSCQGL